MVSYRNQRGSKLVVCVTLETFGLVLAAAAMPGCGGGFSSDSGEQRTSQPGVNSPSTNQPGTNQPGTNQPMAVADPHPAWVVGTYENPGKIDNNILGGQKSITFAADGTYTGFYCKSCGNESGKWAVADGKLVLDGGSFGGIITLATDLTPNCRILDYVNQQFYRKNPVPDCPLGGQRADAQACSFVGTYHVSGTGDISDSALASVEPDYFWYYEHTHIYCVSNQYGSKCLNTTYYQFGTWSVENGALSGVPTSGLTFTHADCASFGAAGDGSAGSSSMGGASNPGSAASSSASGGVGGSGIGGSGVSSAGTSSAGGSNAGAGGVGNVGSAGSSSAGAGVGGSGIGGSSGVSSAGASSAGTSGVGGAGNAGSAGSSSAGGGASRGTGGSSSAGASSGSAGTGSGGSAGSSSG